MFGIGTKCFFPQGNTVLLKGMFLLDLSTLNMHHFLCVSYKMLCSINFDLVSDCALIIDLDR